MLWKVGNIYKKRLMPFFCKTRLSDITQVLDALNIFTAF